MSRMGVDVSSALRPRGGLVQVNAEIGRYGSNALTAENGDRLHLRIGHRRSRILRNIDRPIRKNLSRKAC